MQQLNVTELMTGKDGRLYVTVGSRTVCLAEIESYSTNMEVKSTQKQPVGSILEYDIPTGVSFSLEFTEMVVRDDVILEPLLESIAEGKIPTYDFRGEMERSDGTSQSIAYNWCTPTGTFGLQNLQPGDVVTRQQSFRINSIPKFLKALASQYLE